MCHHQMNWYGFGFNGFGQIVLFDKADCGTHSEKQLKIVIPAALSHSNDGPVKFVVPDNTTEHEKEPDFLNAQITACWSRTGLFSAKGKGQVHLTGFIDGSSDSRKGISGSSGCVDAWITERYVTLRFIDKVECWSCNGSDGELVWKSELDTSPGHSIPLPLVPEGYIASGPPLFRPLSPQLHAKRLALGTGHAILLCADGTIYTWGSGSHGQLGHGNLMTEEEPRVVEALWGLPVSSVAAGGWHSACISEGGDLYMWGWNESGQLGLPSRRCRKEGELNKETGPPGSEQEETAEDVFISIQAFPALLDIPHLSEVSRVSCGSRHTAAVSCQGDLYTWGWGDYGQLGNGNLCSSDQPSIVDFFPSHGLHVEDVTCGPWNTFVSATQADPPGSHAKDLASNSGGLSITT